MRTKTPTDHFRIRLSYRLKCWRRDILAAAGGRCAGCGYHYRKLKYRLVPHHLKSVDHLDEASALDPENGVALCQGCHRDFHLRYGHGQNTREQYIEWHLLRWNRELVF